MYKKDKYIIKELFKLNKLVIKLIVVVISMFYLCT